jgi:N-acetyltransferase
MSVIDFQPSLRGKLVVLRPLSEDDWTEMFRVASDPLIWEGHPRPDRCQEPVFRRFFDDALASGQALAILDAQTGEIIGSSRYHGHDPVLSEVEIGWSFLARRCWGGAYNREVKRLMLDHAFGMVETVVFHVGASNVRSRRAMEKIGGVLRPGVLAHRDDRTGSKVVYEIRKPGLFPPIP